VFQASLFIWQGSIASTELNNFLWNDLSFFSGVMVNIGETDVTEPSVKITILASLVHNQK
jgi:hypothetical protein